MYNKDGSNNMPPGGTPPGQTQEQTDEDEREARSVIESLQSREGVEKLEQLLRTIPSLQTSVHSGPINSEENILRILDATQSFMHGMSLSNSSLQATLYMHSNEVQNRLTNMRNAVNGFQYMLSQMVDETSALSVDVDDMIGMQGQRHGGDHQEEVEMDEKDEQEEEVDVEDVPNGVH